MHFKECPITAQLTALQGVVISGLSKYSLDALFCIQKGILLSDAPCFALAKLPQASDISEHHFDHVDLHVEVESSEYRGW